MSKKASCETGGHLGIGQPCSHWDDLEEECHLPTAEAECTNWIELEVEDKRPVFSYPTSVNLPLDKAELVELLREIIRHLEAE